MKFTSLSILTLILSCTSSHLLNAHSHAHADAEANPAEEASFDPQAVLDHYLYDANFTSADGFTAEQKAYQKDAYVYLERTWENGDQSLNVMTYNFEIQKFQEWGFYPWGTFYVQGEWNEEQKTMFYHKENGEPTAKIRFNDDKSADLEMLNLNNGDFFIWRARITPKE
ncbi:MAG: hypothetical protein CML12_04740 [Puniceicoccaceae bacterium]|nr:hypothetical protein [Puniceicoccaceae bacterium]